MLLGNTLFSKQIPFSFFFFLIRDCIEEKKNAQEYTGVYNELKIQKLKTRGKIKNNSFPQEEPNQSTQSIKDKEIPWMHTRTNS